MKWFVFLLISKRKIYTSSLSWNWNVRLFFLKLWSTFQFHISIYAFLFDRLDFERISDRTSLIKDCNIWLKLNWYWAVYVINLFLKTLHKHTIRLFHRRAIRQASWCFVYTINTSLNWHMICDRMPVWRVSSIMNRCWFCLLSLQYMACCRNARDLKGTFMSKSPCLPVFAPRCMRMRPGCR